MIELANILKISPNGKVKIKKNSGEIQEGQIFFPYGFFGSIKITNNSLAMVFYVDGNNDYPLICPINIIKQPSYNEGDIQIGGFDNETKITITSDTITIKAQNNIIDGDLKITGNIIIEGTSNLQGQATIQGKQFLTHTHSGVQSGSSNTGSVS